MVMVSFSKDHQECPAATRSRVSGLGRNGLRHFEREQESVGLFLSIALPLHFALLFSSKVG